VNLVTHHLSLVTVLVTSHLLRLAVALCVGGSFVTFSIAAEPLAKGIQDNSFLVEEAYNQEPGVVQHILNVPLFFTGSQRDVSISFTQEWPVFSQTHQFSYTIPYTFTENENGFADIRLNYRLQALMESERTPAFAPRFTLVTPTGDADKGFGHDRLGYEVNLPFSKIVSDRWTVHFNAGGSVFPGVKGRDLLNYNLGGSAIYAVSANFNLMLESVVNWEEDVDNAKHVDRTVTGLLSPGARYAVNLPNDAQLVVGVAVPIGITSDAPDYGLFFYCSFEHSFTRVNSNNNK
jgi:Putative MetA-pathway of phenol degradation